MKWFLVALCIIWVNSLDLEDNEGQLGDGLPELYDGDMLLTPEQKLILSLDEKDLWRVSHRNLIYRWPDKTVPYVYGAGPIDGLTNDEKNKVRAAMRYIESKTCVKFRGRKGQRDHLIIAKGKPGCFANTGRTRFARVNLGEERCFKHGTIVHELLHILGFAHSHQAPNRDDYVDIKWENMNKSTKFPFKKLPSKDWTMLDLPYDYASILHYSRKAFSINGKDTIVPKEEGVEIGQRIRLSELDIKRVNKYYKCPEQK
ncbi:astacin-like [Sergentomyia squamirostris]